MAQMYTNLAAEFGREGSNYHGNSLPTLLFLWAFRSHPAIVHCFPEVSEAIYEKKILPQFPKRRCGCAD
jgi:hypothetical protein